MKFIQMMNSGMSRAGVECRRIWLEADRPILLAPHLTFTAYFDVREDERYLPYVRVRTPQTDLRYDLPEGCTLDLTAWCGLKALPRAVEFGAGGRPVRLLVEFSTADQRTALAMR